MDKISIIIPSHNEEGNVELLVKELNNILSFDGLEYEYLFVNDGSKDKTAEIVNELTKTEPRVRLIDFSRNFGKEAAMIAGLDNCIGDAAVIIDADLQMPVHYINDLVKYWQHGEKLVLTYRDNRETGLKSQMASKYYDFFNNLSKTQIVKDALDFQIMDREIIDIICNMREKNRFFKGMTGYLGFSPRIIPVTMEERHAGKSSFGSFKRLFSYAFESFAIYSNEPLFAAIKLGITISILSFIYLIYIVVRTLVFGVEVGGYASLMSVMLFMFGVVISFLGVLGYYVGLIYTEVKNRPIYIKEYDSLIDNDEKIEGKKDE